MSNQKIEDVLSIAKKALADKKVDAIKDALTKVQDLSTGENLSHEEYEDRIEAVIADLVESLRRANEIEEAREEKKIEVDANDNHVVSTADENESDLVPTTVNLPIPVGIPDHAKSAKDLTSVDLINERYPGPDYARGAEAANLVDENDKVPFIQQYKYTIKMGDFVSWEVKAAKSYGIVKEIVTEGEVTVPDFPLRLYAQPEDPVFVCNILRNDHKGWAVSPDTLPVKGSQLILEDALRDSIGNYLDLGAINSKESLKNIKYSDGKFRNEVDLKIVKKSVENYKPNDLQLLKINQYTLVDLTAEDVFTFQLVAADDYVDRGDEQFLDPALYQLAKMYPGNPWLIDHEWKSKEIIGTIYDGWVEDGKLILAAFIPKTADNQEYIDNLLFGKWRKLSVGFESAAQDMLCSACKKSIYDNRCPHEKGETLSDGQMVVLQYQGISDVFEVSVVAVPMQPAAAMRRGKTQDPNKSLSLDTIPSVNDSSVGTKSLMDEEKEKMVMEVPGEKAEDGVESAEMAKPKEDEVTEKSDEDKEKMVMEVPGEKAEDEKKEEKSLEVTPANWVSADDVRSLHEHVKSLHGKVDALHDKCDAIHAKCMSLGMPMEVPGAKSEPSEEEMGLKNLEKSLNDLHKKLDIAMSISVPSLKAVLLEETEKEQVKHKSFAERAGFTIPSKKDSGGQ